MVKQINLNEKFLYEIWKNKNFSKDIFTSDGKQIQIINSGSENTELGGPDFLNAKIKIGNTTFIGDVEIDISHSDWKKHGHYLNKRYNKVILHIVLNNNSSYDFVHSQDGRKIHSVSIASFLSESLKSSVQKAILSERSKRMSKMHCFEVNQLVNENEKLNFLYDLGLKRFNNKCSKMLLRLKELSYLKGLSVNEPILRYDLDENFYNKTFSVSDFFDKDIWLQIIYESVFEALGYTNNKVIMKSLAKSADISFLKNINNENDSVSYFEAALFVISGLMPDIKDIADTESSNYIRKIFQIWGEIKTKFDGRIFTETDWNFFKMRPQNFPTLRIAGGVRFLNKLLNENLIAQILHKIDRISDTKQLAKELRLLLAVKAEDYWERHYTFNQKSSAPIKYFIGGSRTDEIIINIILPIISVYFELFNKKELSKRVIDLYINYYQSSENNLVYEVSSTLTLNRAWKRSVLYQGIIELFRNYCLQEKCLECKIGAIGFG